MTQWLGQRVQVWWPSDEEWFEGRVAKYDSEEGYRIDYDDGDTEWLQDLDDPNLVRRIEDANNGRAEEEGNMDEGGDDNAAHEEAGPVEIGSRYDLEDEENEGEESEEGKQDNQPDGYHPDSPARRLQELNQNMESFSPVAPPNVAKLYQGMTPPRPNHHPQRPLVDHQGKEELFAYESRRLARPLDEDKLGEYYYDQRLPEELRRWPEEAKLSSTIDEIDAAIANRSFHQDNELVS